MYVQAVLPLPYMFPRPTDNLLHVKSGFEDDVTPSDLLEGVPI